MRSFEHVGTRIAHTYHTQYIHNIYTQRGCVHVCKCLSSTFVSLTHGFVGYVHTRVSAHVPSVRSLSTSTYINGHTHVVPTPLVCIYKHTHTLYTAEIHNTMGFCVYTIAHAPHKLTQIYIVCA